MCALELSKLAALLRKLVAASVAASARARVIVHMKRKCLAAYLVL